MSFLSFLMALIGPALKGVLEGLPAFIKGILTTTEEARISDGNLERDESYNDTLSFDDIDRLP